MTYVTFESAAIGGSARRTRTAGAILAAGIVAASFSPVLVRGQVENTLEPTIPEFDDVAEERIVQAIEVRYVGQATVDESRILANMDTRVGEPYSQEKVEGDIKSLFDSGDVDNVNIITEDVPGGVKVIVIVSARSVLGEVLFEGNAGVSDKTLTRRLGAGIGREALLEVGKPFDDADLQLAQAEILERYQKDGYADASVTYRVESTPDGFSRVVFIIDEGSKALLKDIVFEGNTVFKDSELRGLMQVREKSIWRLFIGGGRIDNDVLNEDVQRIEDHYGDAGYIDAEVAVRREPVADGKVNLIFSIVEGESYGVASVALDGLSVYTPEELLPALLTEPGLPYSVSSIRADEKTLRDFYGAKGYADVRVDTRIDRAGPNQLAVVYGIFEGQKSYIRKINISGNQKTKDKVIRRELAVSPGDEYNLVKIDASRRRLQTLQYFSNIDIFPSETGDPVYKDLNIDLTEQSTGSINFGAGFSSIDNLVGFFDIIQTNFDITDWPGLTGGGQRFQLGAKVGTERRDISLSLYEPWFNDYRLGLGGEIYYRDLLFLSDDYDQNNFGSRIYMRKPIGEHAYLQPEYTLQQVEIDVDNDASDELKAEDGDYLESEIGLRFVYDRRDIDRDLIARSGHRFTLGGATSGEFLGGDVDTYGFEMNGSKYFLLPFDTILSFRGEFNVVDAWSGGSDQDVPIFKRVFLGGADTLRGFDYREVGPKDENGEPVGGRTGVFGSVEYSFPIIQRLRGSFFYDIGFVNEDSWDFGTNDVNSNVGVGLRILLGQFPINVSYGIPMQTDEFNDSSGKFNFNIGYQF